MKALSLVSIVILQRSMVQLAQASEFHVAAYS